MKRALLRPCWSHAGLDMKMRVRNWRETVNFAILVMTSTTSPCVVFPPPPTQLIPLFLLCLWFAVSTSSCRTIRIFSGGAKESRAAGRRFNSSQRMCGLGSFLQHGSGSTKNSNAAPCQTILVPDVGASSEIVRGNEKKGGGGGVWVRCSHIKRASGNSGSVSASKRTF